MVWNDSPPIVISSKRGYAITRPDNFPNNYKGKYRNISFADNIEEANNIQKEMQKDLKWPSSVVIWPCWLRKYEGGGGDWSCHTSKSDLDKII